MIRLNTQMSQLELSSGNLKKSVSKSLFNNLVQDSEHITLSCCQLDVNNKIMLSI